MIELAKKEKEVINKYLSGEFDHFTCSDEERVAMTSVIDKANELMEKEDAYDELDDDLIKWFIGKVGL